MRFFQRQKSTEQVGKELLKVVQSHVGEAQSIGEFNLRAHEAMKVIPDYTLLELFSSGAKCDILFGAVHAVPDFRVQYIYFRACFEAAKPLDEDKIKRLSGTLFGTSALFIHAAERAGERLVGFADEGLHMKDYDLVQTAARDMIDMGIAVRNIPLQTLGHFYYGVACYDKRDYVEARKAIGKGLETCFEAESWFSTSAAYSSRAKQRLYKIRSMRDRASNILEEMS